MKNILIASFLLLGSAFVHAQGYDPRALGAQIVDKLTPSLTLTDDQKPQVSDAVIDFLTQKAAIIPLKATDPSGYLSKFNALSGSLIGKMKSVLLARQMTSFLSLKPKATDTGNVLSQLFY